ncbi:MAG: Gfo/Idh/MocA family protein [Armatimonadota bacterium]
MERLRIACIGAGSAIGARTSGFLQVINQLDDMFDHVAIMDISADNARAAAEAYNIPEVYTSLDALFARARPAVVVRLTPTDSTFAVCMAAAEAGCHILNEIPIAFSLAQADAIVAKCQEKGVLFEVAENVWTWPRERLKQMIVAQGLIGEVTHCRLKYPCGAYHGFSAIRKLVGTEAERVLGWEGRVPVVNMLSYGGEPMSETMWDGGLIKFPGHVQCLFEMPPKRPVWRHAWDVEGTRGFIGAVASVVDGAKGHRRGEALVLDDPETLQQLTDDFEAGAPTRERHYPIEWVYGERDGRRVLECVRVNTDPPVVWENPYAKYGIWEDDAVSKATYLESIYRAVVEGEPLVYGAENARRDMELWIAIRESAWRGNVWVELPLSGITSVERVMLEEFERRYGCDPLGDIDKQLQVVYDRTPVMWTVAGWL